MANVWKVGGGSLVVAVALRDPAQTVAAASGVLARLADPAAADARARTDLEIIAAHVLLPDGSVAAPQISGAATLPSASALLQNYPNPFNPSTIIPFRLGDGAMRTVQLEIFNLLGQRIRTLVDAPMRPGAYEIAWDGRDRRGRAAASGIYIYRLSIGNGDLPDAGSSPVMSRRLLLLH